MTRRLHRLQIAFIALSLSIVLWIWIRNLKVVNHQLKNTEDLLHQVPPAVRKEKRPKRDISSTAPPAQTNASMFHKNSAPAEFHSVFSTGCSAFQDWQSYAFFVHALKSGQTGHVTRVASGCSQSEAKALHKVFESQVESMAPGRFHLHLTPDYSKLVKPRYKFFNKPMGLRHWMEEGLGFPHNGSHNQTIFVIFDPDQFIVRPFTQDFSQELWNTQDVLTKIESGHPMAQHYGFGASWIPKIDMTYILGSPDIPSPARTWTRNDVSKHYVVGPPYVAIGSDMYTIVKAWAELAVPVYNLTENHLSEMFAYSVAAAHVGLPHQISHSFMLSDVSSGISGEAWPWIDRYNNTQVCDPHLEPFPHVLHYCQRYYIGPWFFSKYRIPKSESQNFLSCEHPLMAEAPYDIADKYLNATIPNGDFFRLSPLQRKRMAFWICQLLPRLNEAAIFYKQRHCDADANYNKTFMFERDKKN